MELNQIKGILIAFEELGIIINKIDTDKKIIYMSIPRIRDKESNDIPAKETAEKIKAILNGFDVEYNEI